jgi:hypothetical protein
VGPHCSFCGTFTGPFSEVEGLFTVWICIPAWRSTKPNRTPAEAFTAPARIR